MSCVHNPLKNIKEYKICFLSITRDVTWCLLFIILLTCLRYGAIIQLILTLEIRIVVMILCIMLLITSSRFSKDSVSTNSSWWTRQVGCGCCGSNHPYAMGQLLLQSLSYVQLQSLRGGFKNSSRVRRLEAAWALVVRSSRWGPRDQHTTCALSFVWRLLVTSLCSGVMTFWHTGQERNCWVFIFVCIYISMV